MKERIWLIPSYDKSNYRNKHVPDFCWNMVHNSLSVYFLWMRCHPNHLVFCLFYEMFVNDHQHDTYLMECVSLSTRLSPGQQERLVLQQELCNFVLDTESCDWVINFAQIPTSI